MVGAGLVTRNELLDALVDDVPAHRACRQALLQGAEFVVWDDGIPASRLEPIYRRRDRHAQRTGQRTIGLREAVEQLRECGNELVRLGKVTVQDPPCAFILFLAFDRPHVIGCTGVERD
ncbi:hypothetical protein [Micromonospora sp. LH3U1]|uniref:hypothetical protein n=1 Tax=Micromonospora sp. LH3U1 TaxID=3018339 RepID=UPI00234A8215|nr:hypothetical protein [Micromonospora sp. LH3U1]WCN80909.1 hypothetical protein PCA76_29155 [Micromonospora sp. LH3U1]